ncbi:MAG: phosphosulfolactate synthase [Marinilabiliales bacterium]|nr:phosphosulfolactate synthase [Marinilabiliales bacterium]
MSSFGFGIICYNTFDVDEKIKTYHDAGTAVYFGVNTLKHLSFAAFSEYVDLVRDSGVKMIEVSDGSGAEESCRCLCVNLSNT